MAPTGDAKQPAKAEAEAAAETEAEAEPETEVDSRVKRPDLTWKIIALIVAVLVVIAIAFVWEALSSDRAVHEPDIESTRPRRENEPPAGRSAIQDELDALDWVLQEFLPINEFSRPGELLEGINGLVIHYIGNPNTTALQNRNYFENLSVTGERYASSNFIICLDGLIVQCVPVDEIAYASNIRNADTLSIEMCHPDETGEFTDETYASAVRLVAWLCDRYGLKPDDIIRHYDVTGKICPKYFVENEDEWEVFKAAVQKAYSGA